MRIEFTFGVGQATVGGGDASSDVNDLPFSVYCSCFLCDRSQEVDLEFEGGIACSSGEH